MNDLAVEGEVVEKTSIAMVEQLTRGEIDIQIATAKRYPRSIERFQSEAEAMACLDEHTAAECFYALKRGGRTIPGPSARLAEIVASAWGNCRASARIIDESDRHVTAQGAFFDLERNVAVSYETRRRITSSNGQRYGDDMIATTANAAAAIAIRNAVFKGVPKAFWKPIYEKARAMALGGASVTSIKDRRTQMVDFFGKMGVEPEAICRTLAVPDVAAIGPDELLVLKSVAASIKNGETTIDQAFPEAIDEEMTGAEKLKAQMNRGKAKASKKKASKAKAPSPSEAPATSTEVTPDSLIDRLMERDGIDDEQAGMRLDKFAGKLYGQPMGKLNDVQLADVQVHIKRGSITG